MTEPDVGLDTTRLKTRAVRDGDGYVISGRKIWTSTGQVADKMLILTRTTPFEEAPRPSAGMTLFYTDLDRAKVEVREIHKMGRAAVDFEHGVYRRPQGAGWRTASARRDAASSTSCTA